jgi:hypothetical protein
MCTTEMNFCLDANVYKIYIAFLYVTRDKTGAFGFKPFNFSHKNQSTGNTIFLSLFRDCATSFGLCYGRRRAPLQKREY